MFTIALNVPCIYSSLKVPFWTPRTVSLSSPHSLSQFFFFFKLEAVKGGPDREQEIGIGPINFHHGLAVGDRISQYHGNFFTSITKRDSGPFWGDEHFLNLLKR